MGAIKRQGIRYFSHGVDVGIELLPAEANAGTEGGKRAGNRGLGQQMPRPIIGKMINNGADPPFWKTGFSHRYL